MQQLCHPPTAAAAEKTQLVGLTDLHSAICSVCSSFAARPQSCAAACYSLIIDASGLISQVVLVPLQFCLRRVLLCCCAAAQSAVQVAIADSGQSGVIKLASLRARVMRLRCYYIHAAHANSGHATVVVVGGGFPAKHTHTRSLARSLFRSGCTLFSLEHVAGNKSRRVV